MKKKIELSTGFWWCVVIAMFVLMVIGLFSCNPQRRSAHLVTKAFRIDKPTVARITRDSFPCIERAIDSQVRYVPGRIDTITDWQTFYVPGANDTIRVPCRCPDRSPDTVYYDIDRRVLDSAAYFVEHSRTDSLTKINERLYTRIATLETGETGTRKTNRVLWWVAGVGVLGTVLMGFIGTRGGWIVALIKEASNIIQSFKKK